MKKTLEINITLGALNLVRVNESVIVPENVSVSFTSQVYSLGTLVGTAKCGKKTKKFKTTGEPVDLSELFTQAGKVDIELSMIAHGEPVKNWRIEPILVKEINHELVAIPEITELTERVATLEAGISELITLMKSNETI